MDPRYALIYFHRKVEGSIPGPVILFRIMFLFGVPGSKPILGKNIHEYEDAFLKYGKICR